MVLLRILSKIFRNRYPLVGIPVIIQNNKGEILLGKRSKSAPFYASYWGLPGGLMEKGETTEETARREVKEELGVEIKLIKQGKVFNSPSTEESPIYGVNIPYYAKIVKGVPAPKDETVEVKWFKPEEIKKMQLAYSQKELLQQEKII